MIKVFESWVERYFSDEEAILLFAVLAVALAIVLFFGGMLAPVFGGIILAFLLQGLVAKLKSFGLGHVWSVTTVFILFVTLFMVILFLVVPETWRQLTNLFNELPLILARGQDLLMLLPEKYPEVVSEEQVNSVIEQIATEIGQLGQLVLSFSLSSITTLIQLLIYIVLVPILVFFFMKDGEGFIRWWSSLLPEKRSMMNKVAHEMEGQIANYVRGKVVEILVVGVVTYITFAALGLRYSAILALMVGLSVVIPYIGAALVTIPVALIAFFQWGVSSEFMYLMVAYFVIQALDGNVLVPLLFSEAVNLHPVAIIVAVLVFGGLWGFWGVFFAIPLATLVKAVLSAWPTHEKVLSAENEADETPAN